MLLKTLLHDLLRGTNDYWYAWIRRSTYDGSWKEAVHRSALALKLLIYEPTGSLLMPDIERRSYNSCAGAVVASPTFSLPEFIGGTRNWCTLLLFLPCSDSSTRFDIGITERHGSATPPSRSMHCFVSDSHTRQIVSVLTESL